MTRRGRGLYAHPHPWVVVRRGLYLHATPYRAWWAGRRGAQEFPTRRAARLLLAYASGDASPIFGRVETRGAVPVRE